MKVVVLEHLGKKVVAESIAEMLEWIKEILEEEPSNPITVYIKNMSEKEFNNLKEFEGF
jgi:hypothetical protein